MPLPIAQLNFGYSDASQYAHGKEKDFFNKFFHKTAQVEELTDPKHYFLFGDKGTGKTAFSVYACNGNIKDFKGQVVCVSSTEYRRFVELKKRQKLEYSDYSSVWRVILLVLMSQHLKDEMPFWDKALHLADYKALNAAIDSFFNGAFTPEVATVLEIIREEKAAASFKNKLLAFEAGDNSSKKETSESLTLALLGIEKKLKDAICEIRVKATHVIFVDGIDHRPPSINYFDYKACIEGLLDATWWLNNSFFSEQKKIRGRMRVILLCRPDLLHTAGIHNAGSKIRDNGIALNWVTNEREAKHGALYAFTNHIIGCQQPLEQSDWISQYWPNENPENIFREMLRMTWQRPRDIVTLLSILRENRVTRVVDGPADAFTWTDIRNPILGRKFSDYLLSEIRDYSLFYLDASEFDVFLSFFQNLNGRAEFDWDLFTKAYTRFRNRNWSKIRSVPPLNNGADVFLQFLYDMNIIAFAEKSEEANERFVHWSYRERSNAELRPRIKTGAQYEIHPGIAKVLNIGKTMKVVQKR